MIVTKKSLPRRTFLRGLGTALALPLLDGMVPAFAAAAATTSAPRRLGVFYLPNGVIMDKWTPAAEGAGFELTPTLAPIAPFRDRVLVLSGLVNKPASPYPNEGAGDHARASATFLTGVHAKKTEGADIQAGISMDQIAARELGKETQLASLEMTLEYTEMLGACDAGYACAYSNTIAWRSPTTPLPMEIDPRAVFERLFGDGVSTDRAARLNRIAEDRSILDSLSADVARLSHRLGARDRSKLGEYLEAIRDVERRIQRAEEQSSRELPVIEQPAGVPATFEEQAKLMFDLLALLVPSRLDARQHLHDGPRSQLAGLSRDRRAGCASPAVAPSRRRREDRQVHQGQLAAHADVLVFCREAAFDARRRWVAPRPLAADLRRRHQRRQST